ncbi:hypothetical protein [Lapidilactobacillus luobeiensis]|uniref:hypothetical protein n=1 Tax=Lapidilactobacillus luobeiensis TaxID=2950371 RepID=UPI0021C3EA1B|nr:hypothetical protein [Lapidilactobacillus luobeiensis]
MLTVILLLIFIPLLLMVVFSLIAGVVAVGWGMIKFLLPVIVIAALVNLLVNRHRTPRRPRQMSYQTHEERQAGRRPRKDLHDVHVHDHQQDNDDEWSDF